MLTDRALTELDALTSTRKNTETSSKPETSSTDVECEWCRRLRRRFQTAKRCYAKGVAPGLKRWASMSYEQVQAFQKEVEPLRKEVVLAERVLREHCKREGHPMPSATREARKPRTQRKAVEA